MSQGSVGVHLRCCEMFTDHFTTSLLLSLELMGIWQSYRHEE